MFWVYILENPHGKFYIGQTDNLQARLLSHNQTDRIAGKFTRKNGPGPSFGVRSIQLAQLLWPENAN